MNCCNHAPMLDLERFYKYLKVGCCFYMEKFPGFLIDKSFETFGWNFYESKTALYSRRDMEISSWL